MLNSNNGGRTVTDSNSVYLSVERPTMDISEETNSKKEPKPSRINQQKQKPKHMEQIMQLQCLQSLLTKN